MRRAGAARAVRADRLHRAAAVRHGHDPHDAQPRLLDVHHEDARPRRVRGAHPVRARVRLRRSRDEAAGGTRGRVDPGGGEKRAVAEDEGQEHRR